MNDDGQARNLAASRRGNDYERVPFWRTLFYSLGNAAGLLTYTTFTTFVQYFYTTVKGLSPDWVGIGLFGFGFWNAINDPLAGWLSDKTSTRWGRRRFFIGLLTLPTAITFALVWLPPLDKTHPAALMAYFLMIISIYDMFQSIVTLNQDALFPEMYQDTKSRASSASIRQLIGFIIGNGAAVALTPTIYERYGWNWVAALWGILAAAFYFVSLIGIRESKAFAQQADTPLREQLTIVFNNRIFLIVFLVNFMTRLIMAAVVIAMPFYGDYVLGINGEELTQLTTVLFVTGGLSLLLWQHIIKLYGTRSSMISSLLITAVGALPLLIVKAPLTTGIVLGLLGLAMGGALLGPDMLFAEVVDEDYVRTGLRREGMYRGILGFIYRFPPALANLILGVGLKLARYNSDLEINEQPAAVATMIRGFAVGIPLFAIVTGIILLRLYPLHGWRLKDIQQQTAKQRREAEQGAD